MDDRGTAKLRELARRLLVATEARQIQWEDTDRPQGFAYISGTSSALIATVDDDGTHPFELLIIDQSGKVIDSLVSHTANANGQLTMRTVWSDELRDLHTLVRRLATGVDEVVDSLLRSLPPDPATDDRPPF